jgi:peptidoglycan hydrolase-like protein with peptidoglycan-binding domain
MRRGLSSFLAVWILVALFGLAFESTGALAAAGSSHTARQSASQQSASQPTPRSGTRTPGVVTTAPGEGLSSPRGLAAVRALQRRLQRAGANPGPVDGRYGPLTERAVQRFQAAHGLPVDGIAGRHTWVALRAPNRVLSLTAGYGTPAGSQSVRALQRRLQRAGANPGPVDGRSSSAGRRDRRTPDGLLSTS